MGVPEKALIKGDRIIELIPQRSPFVFIDTFYGESQGLFYSGFTPQPDSCFVKDGIMAEPGVIENMAQTAAAATGWSYRERGEDVPVGFIGAVADFELSKLPVTGFEIKTSVRFAGEFGGISLVEAVSIQGDEPIAKGMLKIFINNNEQ